jgi:leucine dehydrogenase
MMRSFSRFVEGLGGRYITTEDVGSTADDMVVIRQGTSHVLGLPVAMGGSGDPSKATGYGVYRGMAACVKRALGADSLQGLTVALQGFGKVGGYLAGHLLADGARVVVTDVSPDALRRAAAMGCSVVEDPEAIFDTPCDVFAPCALGGAIRADTVPRLGCAVVAGSANNQLLTPEDGEALHARGILYGPDYVLNAGGVINLSFETGGGYREDEALERVGGIYDSVERLLDIATADGISPARAADGLADERVRQAREAGRPSLDG